MRPVRIAPGQWRRGDTDDSTPIEPAPVEGPTLHRWEVHRRGAGRTGPGRGGQAGVEREPARSIAIGGGSRPADAERSASLSQLLGESPAPQAWRRPGPRLYRAEHSHR